MSFGLLSGAFRPHGDFCALRAVARLREMPPRYQAKHIRHIQKALPPMNLLLTEVISDVAGETGMKIIRAILAGERDGRVLAKYRNNHVKASETEIAKALQGNWREEPLRQAQDRHLPALKQAVALYDTYAAQLTECGRQLEAMLKGLARNGLEPDKPKRRGGKSKNAPGFDARTLLLRMCGYRRLCGRMDKAKAVTACAHKLARLIYALATQGEAYVDQGQAHYEEKYRQRAIKNLTKRAGALGFQLTPAPEGV